MLYYVYEINVILFIGKQCKHYYRAEFASRPIRNSFAYKFVSMLILIHKVI